MERTWLAVIRVLAGLLFFQHGAEKLWGFAGARVDHDFASLRGLAGPLEVVGGTLLVLGLFTRPVAFILCGEMAVAYFRTWAPRGFFPIVNGGEEAVLFCFFFLWMVAAGAGGAALDNRFQSSLSKLAAWEPQARSLTRVIFGFTFTLHGFRLAFGVLAAAAGRRGAAPMALDQLPGSEHCGRNQTIHSGLRQDCSKDANRQGIVRPDARDLSRSSEFPSAMEFASRSKGLNDGQLGGPDAPAHGRHRR